MAFCISGSLLWWEGEQSCIFHCRSKFCSGFCSHKQKFLLLLYWSSVIFSKVHITYHPSLNTQSCIKGPLVVRDFCFWALWAARPVHKKVGGQLWATFEGGFFMFSGFFENTITSTLKSCLIGLERKMMFF